MAADVLGDLVARDRRSDAVALRVDATGREISYRDFCTTAWKAGHALSHCGVHPGARVALAPDPAPQPLSTLFGAACLGARVTFDAEAAARAVLVPADRECDLERRPGRAVVVYGDAPEDPGITHWERTVWSENPVRPPGERDADEVVLDGAEPRSASNRTQSGNPGSTAYTHREVLAAAARVVDVAGLDADTSVGLRAPLTDPRAVVAGVVAPLSVGGTVVLPEGASDADVFVGDGSEWGFDVADVSL
ncbi:acyl-CoA synthetase family protein [Haloplanus natans]|uniref:AMP-binding protein n=1 Tax=Haloplanus natans TaxID=376171 RepID=UPI000677BC2F|nr:AMP-binding protein [Haloplanus natans]